MTPTNHPAPESERDKLLALARYAYTTGFEQGMRENSSSKGGDPWHVRKDKIVSDLDAILSRRMSASHISELDAASNVCLELAAAHGLATGHGDTVADMIRELFDGLLSRRGEPVAVAKLADELEHLELQFTSVANSYKGYLPYSDAGEGTPDSRTRNMLIKDCTKAFDDAFDRVMKKLYADGARNQHFPGIPHPGDDQESKELEIEPLYASPPAPALDARTGEAWINVEDRLPPPHQDVWCSNRNGWQFQGRICYGMHKPFFTYPRGDGNASNTAPDWIDVTHWRPLADPPIRADRGK